MSHHKYNYVFVSVFSFYCTVFIYEVGLSELSCYVEELFEVRAARHPRHLHWLIPFNSSYIFLSIYIQRAVNYSELSERTEIFCLLELNSLTCHLCRNT